ncbi:MAG: LysR family transcriptional regulator, partial [Gemmatimonadetes bacterium]|nr:LysR family transcriptional regulator [Gemmatimonadota bacterium]
MNHTQLRSFHAVATEGGFTAASRVLNVGQPTITSQVKALERHFDVELFHRRGRRVELTEAGGNLFRIAQRIISLEAEAEDLLNAYG